MSRLTTNPKSDCGSRSTIGFAIALTLLVYAAYANVYGFHFLYDDEFLIQKNRFLQSFDFIGTIFRSCSTAGAGFIDSFYRPLQVASYLLVTQIFGESTVGFHLLNVSMHAVNTMLVFFLGVRLGLVRWAAFCAALIWGLHPLHTEAVTYMSATADPMHVMFLLLSLLCFLAARKAFYIPFTFLSLCFFAAALMSKEAAIVLPALVVALLFLLSEDRRWRLSSYFASGPYWIVAAVYLALRKTVLNFNGDFAFFKTQNVYTDSVVNRTYTFFATLPAYVELIFWPHGLHIDRAFPVFITPFAWPVMIGATLFAVALALIFATIKWPRWAWPGFVALWFFGAHVPESGVLMPLNSFFLEHWMYLPSIGLTLGLGRALEAFVSRRVVPEPDSPRVSSPLRKSAVIPFSVGVALALGAATFVHNYVWETPISLYSNILKYNPQAERVRHNLAMAYSEVGDNDKALEEYDRILRAGGSYPQTFHNVGHLLVLKGRNAEAERYFKHAIEINATFAPSYMALIDLYAKMGKVAEEKEYEEKLVQVQSILGQKAIH